MKKPILEIEKVFSKKNGMNSIFFFENNEVIGYVNFFDLLPEDFTYLLTAALFVLPEDFIERVTFDSYVIKRNIDDIIICQREKEDRFLLHFSSQNFANAFMNILRITDEYVIRHMLKLLFEGDQK